MAHSGLSIYKVTVFRFLIKIRLVSTDLRIEKEAYVYPAISFIGEFGGSLGLFLGVSFLTIFDIFEVVVLIFSNKTSFKGNTQIHNISCNQLYEHFTKSIDSINKDF